MIGVFARMFPSKDSATEVEVESSTWKFRGAGGAVVETADPDAPPAPFAEGVECEGGTVVVSPVLESLRKIFRRKPKD